ncbi:MAG: Uma2 family endonuclease [Rhizobiales bacterium]|nr:Uma2 family endonuclease [Hyphomicrobiales bacterium]
MNVHLPTHMGKQAFLAWVQGREGRYELADGRVVMMVGASRAHGLIVRNLLLVMHGQLDPQRWTVIAEFGLDAGRKTLRYPDIVVDRAGGAGGDHTATEPVMIAEVLSPTTEAVDLGDKAAEYLKLPSLTAYLILAQDRCKAWLWARGNDGFAAGPDVIAGLDKIIRVGALNLNLPLAALYAGVEAGP